MGKVNASLLLSTLALASPLLVLTASWITTRTTIAPHRQCRRTTRIVNALDINKVGVASSTPNTLNSTVDLEFVGEICEPKSPLAYPQQTPHSGRHFRPSHRAYRRRSRFNWYSLLRRRPNKQRFTEGWYYRLTIPEEHVSFAFIISIEDPGHQPPSPLTLACIQVVGPNDEYLVQGDRDDSMFWAWKHQQGLGYIFSYRDGVNVDKMKSTTALSRYVWNETVASGFQILPTSLLGRVRGRDGTKGDILDNDGDVFSCDFDFTVDPICGWGGTNVSDQKSTAGWLSSFPIFEPHWQITLADARATGSIIWKGRTYRFSNAPFYAEKNWGAALPRKWYWTQCNSFVGYEQLSVVAGGGIRKIPFGKEEALGMVSCHFNGTLYEAVPWLGGMSWEVETWGSWVLRGNSTWGDHPFEVEVIYKCNPATTPGLVFRAPTPDRGLVRFCRDTFDADCVVSLWSLEWDGLLNRYVRQAGRPLIDCAKSSQGGAEIGGGPWWDVWKGEARLKRPIRFLLRFPYHFQNLNQGIRKILSRLSST
jgi:tocopherol cyclase